MDLPGVSNTEDGLFFASDSLVQPVIKTAISNTAAVSSVVMVFLSYFIVPPIVFRCMLQRQLDGKYKECNPKTFLEQ